MKRTLSVLFALVLVLALGAPVFAAVDDIALISEDMLGKQAVQVNTNLNDAIEGKVFYADIGGNFAIQMPSFMVSPETISMEDMVMLSDDSSRSALLFGRFPVEDFDEEDLAELEDFAEFAQELEDILNEMLPLFVVEGITMEVGDAGLVELEGMVNALHIDVLASDDRDTVTCVVFFMEAASGDYYMMVGGYLDLTDAELEELMALPSTLIEY